MIVQCPKCQAKFNLADEKITEKGLKVRCSKCKNVFEVKKETATTKDAVSIPESAGKDNFDFGGDFDFAEEKISTERPPQAPTHQDFAFSDDLSTPRAPSNQEKKEAEDFSFEEEADFSTSDEFGAEEKTDEMGMSPDMPEIPSAAAEKNSDTGELGLNDEFGDFKIDRGSEIPARAEPGKPEKAAEQESDEEFDFSAKLESYARPETPLRKTASAGDELEAKLDLDVETEGPSPSVAPAATVQVREPRPTAPARPMPVTYAKEKGGGFKTFIIIVLILILLSPVFALGYLHLSGKFKITELFKPGGFAQLKAVPEVNSLLVKLGMAEESPQGEITILKNEVTYQIINRREGGQIAVVAGKVRNDYNRPVEYIQVEVSLYDANRNLLATGLSYCDVRFTREELATQSQTWIQDYIDTAAGRYMQNQRIDPGMERDFTVVFFQIPPGVEGYDVKVKSFGIIKSGG